ncbi:methyltransferase TRM13-domain-containing protein [Pavlovales sp. CCMP2436]|nr:methyltransferase TRM13-domain-containing protein [Pavlovales sp. CCMP2436]
MFSVWAMAGAMPNRLAPSLMHTAAAVGSVAGAMPNRPAPSPTYTAVGSVDGGGVCPHCTSPCRKLARHLRLCPKLSELDEMRRLPFYAHNANLGSDEVLAPLDFEIDPSQRIAPPDIELVQRIIQMHESLVGTIRVEPLLPDAARSDASFAELSLAGFEKERHRVQCEKIVQQLALLGVVGTGRCHVEIGAGSAGLTLALATHDESHADSHLMLDQYQPRKKHDQQLRELGARFARHKIGLEHLGLRELQHLRAGEGEALTVVSKHLCGEAADFALRAVARCSKPVDAFTLASCCHHRCEWLSYPNRGLFERAGFSRADFGRICRMSSWAVNAPEQDRAVAGPDGEVLRAADGRELRSQELGRLGKELLDFGRVLYLRGVGYDAWIAEYVRHDVTPENRLLVARPAAGRGS